MSKKRVQVGTAWGDQTPLLLAILQALYRLIQGVGMAKGRSTSSAIPDAKVGPKDDGRRVNLRRRGGAILKSGPKLGGDRRSFRMQVDNVIDDVIPASYLALLELGIKDVELILRSRVARRMVRTVVRSVLRDFRRQSARDAKARERMVNAARAHGYDAEEISDGAKLAMVRDITAAKRRGTPDVRAKKKKGAVSRWERHNAELMQAIRQNTSTLPGGKRTFRPGTQIPGNGWKLEDRTQGNRTPAVIDASEGGTGGSVRKDSEGIEG